MMKKQRSVQSSFIKISAAAALAGVMVPPVTDGNAAGLLRIPICANGAIRFIEVDIGDPDAPSPQKETAACHGPCIHTRWKAPRR